MPRQGLIKEGTHPNPALPELHDEKRTIREVYLTGACPNDRQEPDIKRLRFQFKQLRENPQQQERK
jgi:hypothetical protein